MQRALSKPALDAPGILPIAGRGLVLTRGGRSILAGIDFAIDPGSGPLVLIGPNGAGKSVLLRLLAGLLRPDSGSVTWAGTTPDRVRQRSLGFVFQKPVLLRRSVLANLDYALAASGHGLSEQRVLAEEALDRAQLSHVGSSPARALSGGEQQRVALARALCMRPSVLFLDEPTSNLDPASTAAIELQLRQAHDWGVQIVLVTQDMGQARRWADEVVFLHQGRVRERTAAATFFRQPQTPEAAAFLKGELVY